MFNLKNYHYILTLLFVIIIQNMIDFTKSSSLSKLKEKNFYKINNNYQLYVISNNNDYFPCERDNNYNFVKYNDKLYCVKKCYLDSTSITNNPFKCEKLKDYSRGSGYYNKKQCVENTGDKFCEYYNTKWFPKCNYGMVNDGCCVCQDLNPTQCKGILLGYGTYNNGQYCIPPCYEIETGAKCPYF